MAAADLRFLEVSTSAEKQRLIKEYESTDAWNQWIEASSSEDKFEQIMAILAPKTFSQSGGFGSGHSDIFAGFVERAYNWLRQDAYFGMVIPSAFHVSKSLKDLRYALNRSVSFNSYFCFENKFGLFDIHKSWKFTPAVFMRCPTDIDHTFNAQFYLHRDNWLFESTKEPEPYEYPVSLIEKMDSETLIWQEFKSKDDINAALTVFENSITWKKFCENENVNIRRELNATDDRWRIDYNKIPKRTWESSINGLIHHQPGTMHQYSDLWEGAQPSTVLLDKLQDKISVLQLAPYYRICYRTTARATDERTSIYTILPPGTTATNSLPLEGSPDKRSNSIALAFIAICNSFAFDWAIRLRVGSKTVSKFIMEVTPFAHKAIHNNICVHGSLRLLANHCGFKQLWKEQLGDNWQEKDSKSHEWPVVGDLDSRWDIRSCIDAVVANAYGLNHDQYEHILSTFSHSSYSDAPVFCLSKFDELKKIGLEAFCRKYDPYWDIPLNENLPKPVIDLPIPIDDDESRAKRREQEGGRKSRLWLYCSNSCWRMFHSK